MMRYLGLIILAFIFAEVYSIVWIVGKIGGLQTLLLIAVSFVSGLFLLRNMGISALMLGGEMLRSGGISLYQMLWPIRLPLAGILLMSPGVVSSVLALILLIPFKGKPLKQSQDAFSAQFGTFHTHRTQNQNHAHDDDIIEGEFTVQNDRPKSGQQRLKP